MKYRPFAPAPAQRYLPPQNLLRNQLVETMNSRPRQYRQGEDHLYSSNQKRKRPYNRLQETSPFDKRTHWTEKKPERRSVSLMSDRRSLVQSSSDWSSKRNRVRRVDSRGMRRPVSRASQPEKIDKKKELEISCENANIDKGIIVTKSRKVHLFRGY